MEFIIAGAVDGIRGTRVVKEDGGEEGRGDVGYRAEGGDGVVAVVAVVDGGWSLQHSFKSKEKFEGGDGGGSEDGPEC
ncbi:unnamed protein product [marine sediment metagenome]|uniref:Uncharacterized protein n=1 Tax=marine sediment metagenome TaxID=412755 RepID=X1R111_9ZZZZ